MAHCYILSYIWISDIRLHAWNSRPRILISGPGFESKFVYYSLNPLSRFLGSWSVQGFHQIWSLNWQHRRKLILSIYINRLLHRVWYLNYRCPLLHLKLLAKDLNSRSRTLISGQEFESGFVDYSLNPQPQNPRLDIIFLLRFSLSYWLLRSSRNPQYNEYTR